jgi:hypothetical protein
MAAPTSFEWQIEDDQGLTNRSQMFVAYDASTETVSALQGAWSAYGGLIDAVIDGKIVGGAMNVPLLPDPSWKAAANHPGNNVNQVMNLNFGNDFNLYRTPILLPSYQEAVLQATPPYAPDLADTALAALIAAILHGTPSVTPEVFPNASSLHDLNALLDAFLTVRKVRAGRARTKVTPG